MWDWWWGLDVHLRTEFAMLAVFVAGALGLLGLAVLALGRARWSDDSECLTAFAWGCAVLGIAFFVFSGLALGFVLLTKGNLL